MTSAVERVEAINEQARIAGDGTIFRLTTEGQVRNLTTTDLTELVRLAKLGARVEQCEFDHVENSTAVVTPDGERFFARGLLAWLKDGA